MLLYFKSFDKSQKLTIMSFISIFNINYFSQKRNY